MHACGPHTKDTHNEVFKTRLFAQSPSAFGELQTITQSEFML